MGWNEIGGKEGTEMMDWIDRVDYDGDLIGCERSGCAVHTVL